uniref:Beta/gamma crystallin 'Greek key' domain-containing protein n=1 Tax=Xenopus tropicalis TaxID=8364 RepID=A0A6I8S250_XENTR
MEREAMILSSFAGVLMHSLPVEGVFELYGKKSSKGLLQSTTKNLWTQPFNLSLHPFAMLTAPKAAEHAWKHRAKLQKSSHQNAGCSTRLHNLDTHEKEKIETHDEEVHLTEDPLETIIFYEDRNFGGRFYECDTDSSDLISFFNRCGSIRVEHGNWIIYEFPNFGGYQYFLKRGEYPDFNKSICFGDSIRSCRIIPQHGTCRIRVYEKEDFKGQMMEFTEDCPQVYEKFNHHNISSCNVVEGHWIFYDEPNYKGCHYYLRPGEYKRYNDWGAVSSR